MEALNQRSSFLLIWMICLVIVCGIFLTLRYWAARLVKRRLYADDVLVCIAYVTTLCVFGLCTWAIYDGGFGKYRSELTPVEAVVLGKFRLAGGVARLMANGSSKLSVLFLYHRVFTTKTFRLYLNLVIAVTLSYMIVFFILYLSRCRPLSHAWEPTPGGWCRDSTIEEFIIPCLSLFLDTVILVLPMPVLWGLQMPPRKKIAISVMFGLGIITVGIMIWRVYTASMNFRRPEYDSVYHMPDLYLIVMLELCLSIVAACIPTLAPLAIKYFVPIMSRDDSGQPKPSARPSLTLETIGAKPSRRIYHRLGAGKYRFTSTTYIINSADSRAETTVPEKSVIDNVQERNDAASDVVSDAISDINSRIA
jgi:hypothetical protein